MLCYRRVIDTIACCIGVSLHIERLTCCRDAWFDVKEMKKQESPTGTIIEVISFKCEGGFESYCSLGLGIA